MQPKKPMNKKSTGRTKTKPRSGGIAPRTAKSAKARTSNGEGSVNTDENNVQYEVAKFERESATSTFLLRMPRDVRDQLEALQHSSEAKSLQGLLLQLIAEGLSRRGEFEATELFAKDLHVKSLDAAIRGTHDIAPGGFQIFVNSPRESSTGIDVASLLPAHERVVRDLEDQKLTGFAALMDPALMSYRLLLQFATQAPTDSTFAHFLIRDFSNGLKSSAEHAMQLGRWGLAESLLFQACEIDPKNEELVNLTGIYVLRRLTRRWFRQPDQVTSGVTSKTLVFARYGTRRNQAGDPPEEMDSQTHWGTAERVYRLLMGVHGHRYPPHNPLSVPEDRKEQFWKLLTPREQCWFLFSKVIYSLTNPDHECFRKFEQEEAEVVTRIVSSLREWEQSFRMTRDVAALQSAWRSWFEAIEIFWWLGYRQEVHEICRQIRSFTSDKATMRRFQLINEWTPQHESIDLLFDYERVVIWTFDEFKGPEYRDLEGFDPTEQPYPEALFERPDGE